MHRCDWAIVFCYKTLIAFQASAFWSWAPYQVMCSLGTTIPRIQDICFISDAMVSILSTLAFYITKVNHRDGTLASYMSEYFLQSRKLSLDARFEEFLHSGLVKVYLKILHATVDRRRNAQWVSQIHMAACS